MEGGSFAPLTAERRRPPPSDLSAGSLASSSVSLQAVAQSFPRPSSSADIMEAMLEVLSRVHPMVAGPKRPRWVADEAALIPASVRSNGSGVARRARLPVATFLATPVGRRRFPRGDEFLRALGRRSVGEQEIVTGISVKVAPQTAHATLVSFGDGDQQIRGCVVEQAEA